MNTQIKHELKDDSVEWRLPNGILHREDGPALIFPNGSEHWYLNDLLHREDGPAVIDPDGTKHWVLNGLYHREDGPAIIYSDGTTRYWLDGIEYDPVTFLIKSYEYTKEA